VILEHAVLSVKPGEEAAFEVAFARARPIIAAMPGFIGLTLSRCLGHYERVQPTLGARAGGAR
jgi:heme-degrading monooxygenase HmoA